MDGGKFKSGLSVAPEMLGFAGVHPSRDSRQSLLSGRHTHMGSGGGASGMAPTREALDEHNRQNCDQNTVGAEKPNACYKTAFAYKLETERRL